MAELNAGPRIAIVHERLTEIAGSELVVGQFAEEWPTAPVSIPIVDSDVAAPFMDRVETGWLSRVYRATGRRTYAPLLPFEPAWFRRRDFGSADAVLISHHAFAVAVAHAAGTRPTVAYVHSPARWAWDEALRYLETESAAGRTALGMLAHLAIRTELGACQKLTAIVANSTAVADRIRRHWGRESHVVHPPVDTEFYTPGSRSDTGDYFLLAGRLVAYKHPDIAVKAAVAAGVKLVVAGDGREASRCKAIGAGADVTFLGRVTNDELRDLQRRARATLLPGEEDFGIVPVEAMACGTPVIALGVGGACDSVVEGVSGTLVHARGDAEVIAGFADAMAQFDDRSFDPAAIRAHAEKFSRREFRRKMAAVVSETLAGNAMG